MDFLKLSPAQARQRLRPTKLVDALGIKEYAGSGEFTEGLRTLFENSSGNFAIDRAANEEAYKRVAARGSNDPEGVLAIIREVRPRVSELIAYKPGRGVGDSRFGFGDDVGFGVGVGACAGTTGSAHILDFLL